MSPTAAEAREWLIERIDQATLMERSELAASWQRALETHDAGDHQAASKAVRESLAIIFELKRRGNA